MGKFTATPPSKPKPSNPSKHIQRAKSNGSPRPVSSTRKAENNSEKVLSNGRVIFRCAVQKRQRSLNFVVREFLGSLKYFSIDITVAKTKQKWSVVIPVSEDIDELLRVWSISPKYENKHVLAEWLLRVTKIEFSGDVITGAVFDSESMQIKCVQEMTILINTMASKIQAIYRMYRVRHFIKNARFGKARVKKIKGISFDSMAKRTRGGVSTADVVTTSRTNSRMYNGYGCGEASFRSSTAGDFPGRKRKKPSTRLRSTPEKDEYVQSRLMQVSTSYISSSPRKNNSTALKEIRNLKAEISGVLESFQTELCQMKSDFNRSMLSMGSVSLAEQESFDDIHSSLSFADNTAKACESEVFQFKQDIENLNMAQSQQKCNSFSQTEDADFQDPEEKKALVCIRRALTAYAKRRKLSSRIRFLCNEMVAIVEGDVIREALCKSVESGSIELAICVVKRIIDIFAIHGDENTSLVSNYLPTTSKDVGLICHMLCSFVSIRTITFSGFDILHLLLRISTVEGMEEIFGESGVCDFILVSLIRHGKSFDISFLAITLFSHLVSTSVSIRWRMLSVRYCQVIGRALQEHSSHGDLVKLCIRILRKLSDEVSEPVFENFKVAGVYLAMIYCLSMQYRNAEIVRTVCHGILTLCSSPYQNSKRFFMSSENSELYSKCLLETYEDEKTFRSVTVTIVMLCGDDSKLLSDMATDSMVTALCTILRIPNISEDVIKHTVMIIHKFSSVESLRLLCLSKGVDEVLLDLCKGPVTKTIASGVMKVRYHLVKSSKELENATRSSPSSSPTVLHQKRADEFKDGGPTPCITSSEPGRTNDDAVDRSLSAYGEEMQSIRECNDIKILLNFLYLSVMKSNAVLAQCTVERIKHILIEVNSIQPTNLSFDTRDVTYLLQVMSKFLSSVDIQKCGVQILQHLLADVSHLKLAVDTKIYDNIFVIIEAHSKNAGLCMVCLDYLCMFSSCNLSNHLLLGTPGKCHTLSNILTCHINDPDVPKECCRLIQHLCQDSSSCREYMAVAGVSGQILEYLKEHSSDEDSVSVCVETIAVLCTHESESNSFILASRHSFCVYTSLLMNNLQNSSICKNMCMLLSDLCGRSSDYIERELINSDVVGDLCNALDELRQNKSIPMENTHCVLTLIGSMLLNSGALKERFYGTGLAGYMGYFRSGWTQPIISIANVILGYMSSVSADDSGGQKKGSNTTSSESNSVSSCVKDTSAESCQLLLESIAETTDLDLIVRSLQQSISQGNHALAFKAISRLYYLCKNGKVNIVESDIKLNLQLLINIMNSFLSRSDIQRCGIGILQHLTSNVSTAREVGLLGGGELVGLIVFRHMSDPGLCALSLQYGCRLVKECTENRLSICTSKFCEALGNLMTTHSAYTHVLNKALSLINYLCVESADNRSRLGRCGICGYIMQYLIDHSRDEEACILCAKSIIALSTNNDVNRSVFVNAQNIQTFFRVITENDTNVGVCKYMSKLLVVLSGDGIGFVTDELTRSNLVRDIASFVSREEPELNPEVAETVLLIAIHFAVNVRAMRQELLSAGMVAVFGMYTAKKYGKRLRQAAVLAIKNISDSGDVNLRRLSHTNRKINRSVSCSVNDNSAREEFGKASGKMEELIIQVESYVDANKLLDCLESSIDDDSYVLASRTLSRLCVLSSLDKNAVTARTRIKAVLGAMVSFLGHADIQRTGINVLQQLTYSVAHANQFVEAGVCGVIELVLHRYETDADLIILCFSYFEDMIRVYPACVVQICNPKCCDVISRIMKLQARNMKLMLLTCRLLYSMSSYSDKNRCILGKSGVDGCITAFMCNHMGEEECVAICTRIILSLCTDGNQNTLLFSSKENLNIFSHILWGSKSSPRVCKHVCTLLSTICGSEDDSVRPTICDSTIPMNIVNILSTDDREMNHDVAQAVLLLAVHFAVHIPMLRPVFLAAGIGRVFESYTTAVWPLTVRNAATIGLRKLSLASRIENVGGLENEVEQRAAKKITRSASFHLKAKQRRTERNEAMEKIKYYISQVDSCTDIAVVMDCIDFSVESGSHVLAVKSITRLLSISRNIHGDKCTLILSRIPSVISVMTAFLSCRDIQISGLTMLCKLQLSTSGSNIVGETGGGDLVYYIIFRHMSDPVLCTHAIRFGCSLARGCNENRLPMCKHKCCQILVDAMKEHDDYTELQNQACELIEMLSYYSSENRDRLGRSGACGTIVKHLIKNMANEDVCTVCIRAIQGLCSNNNKQNRAILGSDKHFSLYVLVVWKNIFNANIVKMMTSLITDLCDGKDSDTGKELAASNIVSELSKILISLKDKKDETPVCISAEAVISLVVHLVVNIPAVRPQLQAVDMTAVLTRYISDDWNESIRAVAGLGIEHLREDCNR